MASLAFLHWAVGQFVVFAWRQVNSSTYGQYKTSHCSPCTSKQASKTEVVGALPWRLPATAFFLVVEWLAC